MTDPAEEHPFPPLPPSLPCNFPVRNSVFSGGFDGTVLGARLEGDEQQSAADADADHPLASGAEGASSPDLSLSGLDPPPFSYWLSGVGPLE